MAELHPHVNELRALLDRLGLLEQVAEQLNQLLRMVANAGGASLDMILSFGEAACWPGY